MIIMTILWNKERYTINDYIKDCEDENKEELARFIYGRFCERYIEPLESIPPDKKNGFSIMAITCLMIETLENFWQGKGVTPWKKGNDYFENFFTRCVNIKNNLAIFKGVEFYKQIRCGILHQAETKGGWTIRREGPLLKKEEKVINATRFLNSLKEYLKWYRDELRKRDFKKDVIWKNFKLKMKAIKKNCEFTS
jgi:hypothetical protein